LTVTASEDYEPQRVSESVNQNRENRPHSRVRCL